MSFGLYTTPTCVKGIKQNKSYLVQIIDNHVGTGVLTISIKGAVMNKDKVTIVTQIIQLITNYFLVKPHVQRDTERNLMDNMGYIILQTLDLSLFDSIPEAVLNDMKEHQPKRSAPNFDSMLYINMKQMV